MARCWNGLVSADRTTLPSGPGDEGGEAALVAAALGRDETGHSLLRTARHEGRPRTRVLALRGLLARGDLEGANLAGALADPSPEVRREAAEAAARVLEPPTADLLAALSDEDPLVVEAAAYALGERADAVALEALSHTAREHPDPRCRESAVAALGAIGDPRGLAAVLVALEDRPPVRRRAAVSLAAFEGPEVDAALHRALEDRDWQVRDIARRLLES